MGIIKILPEHVIAKIAAGEVVERPASVVKELVDNAIDAGATSIEIDVAAGGKGRITVVDDGRGMDENDAKLCVERHATSKISSEADLFKIRTMGFRGEALASIAAISNVDIETRAPGRIEGTLVRVAGGAVREVRAVGCPQGTRIVVSDLFYNVPARKKFLKSDPVEFGHVSDLVSSLALAAGTVRFELSHNGEPKIRCRNTGGVKNRIGDVLGAEVGDSLFEFAEKGAGIELSGFIVKGGLTRATAKDIHFFVNGRPVKDRILQHALLSGLETFLPRGTYPVAVLYLTMDPEIVDVNVHPTKREVRFANGGMVHDFVAAAVRKAFAGGVVKAFVAAASRGGEAVPNYIPPPEWGSAREGVITLPLIPSLDGRGEDSAGLRVIGQLDRAFIVCEGEEGKLVLIDQHAAHERLGFEALRGQLASGGVARQMLLLPEQLRLTSKGAAVIMEHKDALERAGFEIEPFGGDTILVKAQPSILGDVSLRNLFEKISSELSDFESSGAADEEMDRIFSVIACHRQVRAGDALGKEEMESLVREVEHGGVSQCPHGRPAVVAIERAEVDKWFKRS